jgi:hypothetical protein
VQLLCLGEMVMMGSMQQSVYSNPGLPDQQGVN